MHERGKALKKRLLALDSIIQQNDLSDMEFDRIRRMLSSIGESMDHYTVEQKRAAIRTFIRKIVWDGENAHLYLFHNDEEYQISPLSIPNNDTTDEDSAENLPDTRVPSGEDSE